MDNEVNDGGEALSNKKKENWMELCRDCKIVMLELECAFGCELILAKQKRKRP